MSVFGYETPEKVSRKRNNWLTIEQTRSNRFGHFLRPHWPVASRKLRRLARPWQTSSPLKYSSELSGLSRQISATIPYRAYHAVIPKLILVQSRRNISAWQYVNDLQFQWQTYPAERWLLRTSIGIFFFACDVTLSHLLRYLYLLTRWYILQLLDCTLTDLTIQIPNPLADSNLGQMIFVDICFYATSPHCVTTENKDALKEARCFQWVCYRWSVKESLPVTVAWNQLRQTFRMKWDLEGGNFQSQRKEQLKKKPSEYSGGVTLCQTNISLIAAVGNRARWPRPSHRFWNRSNINGWQLRIVYKCSQIVSVQIFLRVASSAIRRYRFCWLTQRSLCILVYKTSKRCRSEKLSIQCCISTQLYVSKYFCIFSMIAISILKAGFNYRPT